MLDRSAAPRDAVIKRERLPARHAEHAPDAILDQSINELLADVHEPTFSPEGDASES
jgi:hypothetical protein